MSKRPSFSELAYNMLFTVSKTPTISHGDLGMSSRVSLSTFQRAIRLFEFYELIKTVDRGIMLTARVYTISDAGRECITDRIKFEMIVSDFIFHTKNKTLIKQDTQIRRHKSGRIDHLGIKRSQSELKLLVNKPIFQIPNSIFDLGQRIKNELLAQEG